MIKDNFLDAKGRGGWRELKLFRPELYFLVDFIGLMESLCWDGPLSTKAELELGWAQDPFKPLSLKPKAE